MIRYIFWGIVYWFENVIDGWLGRHDDDDRDFHYGSDGVPYSFPNRRVEDNKDRVFHVHIAGEAGQIASAPYPHCDDLVLHAPGKCEVCDLYPTYQAARIAKGVNFTGEHRADRTPCPATLRRPLETIERWPGNREWEA